MNITKHVEEIRARARRLGFSKSGLAMAAGLHKNTLRHFDRPGWSPRLVTLERLEAALDQAERRLQGTQEA